MKVIGIETKSGEYQGRKYENIILHVAVKSCDIAGVSTNQIKVKSSRLADILSCDLKDIYEKNIDVYYDEYRNVCRIDVK